MTGNMLAAASLISIAVLMGSWLIATAINYHTQFIKRARDEEKESIERKKQEYITLLKKLKLQQKFETIHDKFDDPVSGEGYHS